MTGIRVLVVEDSLTVRARLCEVLRSQSSFEVVGEAANSKDAIAACLAHRPDVVTMDMVLAQGDGLEATEYIMAHCPTPILVVSASFNRGELFKSYEALAAGALEVIEKPTGKEPDGEWEARFLSTLRIVSKVRVITHLRGKLAPRPLPHSPPALTATNVRSERPLGDHRRLSAAKADVVAIGASTGGPSAVAAVLQALPQTFQTPILLVVHLGEPFAPAFVEWLSTVSKRPVALAKDGERVSDLQGQVRVGLPGRHLAVRAGRLRLEETPPRHSCCPSVDVLFESLADNEALRCTGVLLTGMGRDGALGLLRLRQCGASTIAQDEASSIVYGMPKEAVALGAAERVLSLPEIGPALAAANSEGIAR